MYRELRSTGALSYAKVEAMFEEHQAKWPEAIFNEDSWFKYIDPLVKGTPNAQGEIVKTGAYLSMMQGSKAEQRKWWLYNRFRYIDSKYNAGDALSDLIQVRGYAVANVTVTPYADIYPSVKYGSYLVQERGHRGTATTLVCPLDNVNDTEIYIYSASQLASVGDLSGLLVGFADFSMATRLQSLKIGDASTSYSNTNLKELHLGSNVLLATIDVRNCPALGTGDQKTVDLSGCTGLEHVYFDGTAVAGVTLPNGGILKTIHLPGTITNLTIRNQTLITDLTIPSYANISTLRLENVPTLDTRTILESVSASTRVRLTGFYWEAEDADDIESILDLLDTMRGLDEAGGNVDTAQVAGTIHTAALTGAQIAAFNARYPYLTITADHTTAVLTYYNYDGTAVLYTETVNDGGNGTYTGTPARTATAQYTYTFAGWSRTPNGEASATATQAVSADRPVYAAYTATLRTYTVIWKNAGNTTLETDLNVPWGTVPHYDGSTPTYDGQTSTGWLPDPTVAITGDTTYTAQYKPVYTVTFKNDTGSTTLDTQRVVEGGTATYGGTTPTSSEDASLAFLGWATAANSHTANAVLTNIQASMTVYAAFESAIDVSEITDTWDQIIASIDAGTYSTKYKLGQYKPLDLGDEGIINMQIVGMDVDELSDGTGYAPLTFIGMELLNTLSKMANTGAENILWSGSVLRSYLTNTIKPLIKTSAPNIFTRLCSVKKYSYNRSTSSAVSTTEDVWVPSKREVGGTGTYTENAGPVYTIFEDNESRKRLRNSTGAYLQWWLRSHAASKKCAEVSYLGVITARTTSENGGICLGFCLGAERETITDSWSTILANQNYATDYSIGDTKMLNLGTEGKHLMEIVAFDEDDKADGTGKAGITWISKNLLNSIHGMNSTRTTSGGWEVSEMRSYLKTTIKPLIPETVRNGIVEVSKVSSIYSNGKRVVNGQTTTDDVWIPSSHEIFNTSNISGIETVGAVYSQWFTSADKRIKKSVNTTTSRSWWLRSVNSSEYFLAVNSSGASDYKYASTVIGIALGFCTN